MWAEQKPLVIIDVCVWLEVLDHHLPQHYIFVGAIIALAVRKQNPLSNTSTHKIIADTVDAL